MPATVIMPALELAQETGKVIRWLKAPGDAVSKGEPLVEIETDKVTVQIEAPASGVLGDVTAAEGDVVPVGHTIALILAPGERAAARRTAVPGPASAGARSTTAPGPGSEAARPGVAAVGSGEHTSGATPAGAPAGAGMGAGAAAAGSVIKASPLARRIAQEHGVDLAQVKTASGRIEKADVLAHVESRGQMAGAASTAATSPGAQAAAAGAGMAAPETAHPTHAARAGTAGLALASPKARRLATERGVDLRVVQGSGPGGAVLADDVPAAASRPAAATARAADAPGVGTVWRIMAERMTASWTSAPHFYLVREVNVSRLAAWREQAGKRGGPRVTYSDLLVKLVAATLSRHPDVNASWADGAITRRAEVNVGLAVAIPAGLVVPVIHRADTLSLAEIAERRDELVGRSQAGTLRPADIQGGGFTISNLGMYGVDAFNAIVNPPQAAILAVGRIADRVVAQNGQPAVQPTMMLTLSCDHRALDGARGAQFLGALADLVEEPLGLMV